MKLDDAEYPGHAHEDPSGGPADGAKADNQAGLQKAGRRNGADRKDKGRLHAVRDSVLSRGLLEILTRYGENPRKLRRMEAELRADLRPAGPLGNLIYGRFWSSVLRLILGARLEETGLAPRDNASTRPTGAPTLREGLMPILETTNERVDLPAVLRTGEVVEPDLFRRLALIARYDRAASKEMYRTLALLILMRDDGEKGLASGIRAATGIKTVDGEEK
jgi:hypothetical protein